MDGLFGNDGLETQHPTIGSECVGKVSSKKLLRRLELQGYKCALTGVVLTPQNVELDHIKALDDGGADDMTNVQLVHATVNKMKRTMSQEDFVHWCKQVATHCIDQ